MKKSISEDRAWEIYNLINEWRAGEFGILSLQEAIDKELPDNNEPKWINVNERKPEDGQVVIVACPEEERRSKGLNVLLAEYTHNRFIVWLDFALTVTPTHWMSLPEMPKE